MHDNINPVNNIKQQCKFVECTTLEQINATYDVMQQLRYGTDKEQYAELVKIMQSSGKKYTLIGAFYNNKCIAIIGFSYDIYRLSVKGKVIYIEDLVVDENHRGYGIAKELLAYVEEIARQENCKVLILDSGTHRTDAHKFYDIKTGFTFSAKNYKKFLD